MMVLTTDTAPVASGGSSGNIAAAKCYAQGVVLLPPLFSNPFDAQAVVADQYLLVDKYGSSSVQLYAFTAAYSTGINVTLSQGAQAGMNAALPILKKQCDLLIAPTTTVPTPITTTTVAALPISTSKWGFNNPEILAASPADVWIKNQGGGTITSKPGSFNSTTDRWPTAVIEINAASGKPLWVLNGSHCGTTYTIAGKHFSTCGVDPNPANFSTVTQSLNTSSCSNLVNKSISVVAVDSNYAWVASSTPSTSAHPTIVQIDTTRDSCRTSQLQMELSSVNPAALSSYGVSNGKDFWLARLDGVPSITEIDELTGATVYSKQLPVSKYGVTGNIVLSGSTLLIPADIPSKSNCPGAFGSTVPCTDPFAILIVNANSGAIERTITGTNSDIGSIPKLDGFGTLSIAPFKGDMWVAAPDAGKLVEFNLLTGKVINQVAFSRWTPEQVAIGGNEMWVWTGAGQGLSSQTVSEYSVANGKLIRTLTGSAN